jgi:predicted small integral membrane protein
VRIGKKRKKRGEKDYEQNCFFFALLAILLALSFAVEAQQPKKVPRVGLLFGASPSSNTDRTEAFRQALLDLGYIEGKIS